MADKDTEQPKKKKFTRMLPKMPWQRQYTGIGSSISLARSALRRSRASCPSCDNGFLKVTNAIEYDDDSTTTSLLVCNACGYTQNITVDLNNVAAKIADLRIGERRFLLAALGAFVIGILYLLVAGNLFTLIGATFIAVLFFTNALVFRYRVWQISHRKLFLKKPPFGEWLRYELSNSKEEY